MSDEEHWLERVLSSADNHHAGLESAWLQLEKLDLISRVVVHRFVCGRGCGVLGTVIAFGGRIILRTRDYKASRGLNRARSVAEARERNTLDGERHWPAYLIDLERDGGAYGNVEVVCRHGVRRIEYHDALTRAREATAGRPGKPTLL